MMKVSNMFKKLAVACSLILSGCQADSGHFHTKILGENPSYIDVNFRCDPENRVQQTCSDLVGRLNLASNNQGNSAVFRGGIVHHVGPDGHLKVFGDNTSFTLFTHSQRVETEVPVTFSLTVTPDFTEGSEHNGFIVERAITLKKGVNFVSLGAGNGMLELIFHPEPHLSPLTVW